MAKPTPEELDLIAQRLGVRPKADGVSIHEFRLMTDQLVADRFQKFHPDFMAGCASDLMGSEGVPQKFQHLSLSPLIGRSFDAKMVQEPGTTIDAKDGKAVRGNGMVGSLMGKFFIQKGLKLGGMSPYADTDSVIDAADGGTLHDTSVGLYLDNKDGVVCSICGNPFRSDLCDHWPGDVYDEDGDEPEEGYTGPTQTCYAIIMPGAGHMYENSFVDIGAVENAGTLPRGTMGAEFSQDSPQSWDVANLKLLPPEGRILCMFSNGKANYAVQQADLDGWRDHLEALLKKHGIHKRQINALLRQVKAAQKDPSTVPTDITNRATVGDADRFLAALRQLTLEAQPQPAKGGETVKDTPNFAELSKDGTIILSKDENNVFHVFKDGAEATTFSAPVEKEEEVATVTLSLANGTAFKSTDMGTTWVPVEMSGSDEVELAATAGQLAEDLNKANELKAAAEAALSIVQAERDQFAVKVQELEPLAAMGQEFRADLVERAVKAGVRVFGNEFEEDWYRGEVFATMPVAKVRTFADKWEKQASASLATRAYVPEAKEPPATPRTDLAADTEVVGSVTFEGKNVAQVMQQLIKDGKADSKSAFRKAHRIVNGEEAYPN